MQVGALFPPNFPCRENTGGPRLLGLLRFLVYLLLISLKTKSALGQTKSLRDDISAFAATISARDAQSLNLLVVRGLGV